MTNNILDIYERLYNASDNIKGETIDYNRGFQDAIYLLKVSLNKYEHINLHIENKRLKRQLLLLDLNFDDSLHELSRLRKELEEVKIVRKVQAKADAKELNLCELEVGGFKFQFFIDAEQDAIDANISGIGEYITQRLSKSRRNGRPRNKTDYKAWSMQYLRDKGIKCIA